jgi:hypothetical protein
LDIAHCEAGSRNISLDNIEKIACAFKVPMETLVYSLASE